MRKLILLAFLTASLPAIASAHSWTVYGGEAVHCVPAQFASPILQSPTVAYDVAKSMSYSPKMIIERRAPDGSPTVVGVKLRLPNQPPSVLTFFRGSGASGIKACRAFEGLDAVPVEDEQHRMGMPLPLWIESHDRP